MIEEKYPKWNVVPKVRVLTGKIYTLREMLYSDVNTAKNLARIRRLAGYWVRVEKIPKHIFGEYGYVLYERNRDKKLKNE